MFTSDHNSRDFVEGNHIELLVAIVASLNEPGKVADLERVDLWHSTLAVPLEALWPDEPKRGNRPMPE
jgi:hypothetical protein